MNQQLSFYHTLPASGEAFQVTLDGRRAAYLPLLKTLLVSDLHWGKSEIFQKHGIPIPDSLLQADLSRLSDLIETYQPDRILVLGDLIHGKMGLTEVLHQKIAQWRDQNSLPITLIAGNHDRSVRQMAALWDIQVIEDTLQEEMFIFSHEPIQEPSCFNWCGHIHPTIRIRSFNDTMRLPCFHIQSYRGTLPAFSEFTGGFNIQMKPNEQAFAIADGILLPLQ